MSLRLKLALLAAALVAFAVGAVTVTSSRVIADRLNSEVDRSLADAVTQAESALPERGRPSPPRPSQRPGFQLGAVGVAVLSDSGDVTASLGADVTAVNDADRATARRAAAATPKRASVAAAGVFSTRQTDSGDVRALTVPLPGTGAMVVERSLAEVQTVISDLQRRAILVGLVVVLAAAALGWLLTLRATEPLEALRRATGELADGGALSSPLPRPGNDEVGQLAGSFATMVERLEASRAQQRALVEDAGHELRTPLTSLRLNLEVLARYPDLPEAERGPLLADLEAEVNELSTLTNEIVELATERTSQQTAGISGTGTGAATVAPDKTQAHPMMLERIAERVARRARRRTGRDVEVSCDDASRQRITMSISAPTVERAIANLVDNSLKFTEPDSPPPLLTVRATGNDLVTIEVTDRGPGIPADELTRIFDRFHRAETARSAPGSGLGLAIVASAAEAAGGTTWARNNPEGGATVGFSIAG